MAKWLPILTFHRIDEHYNPICYNLSLFEYAITKLWEMNYTTISLEKAVNCLKTKKEFPDKCVVITFDDGDRSVYTQALAILQKFQMTATIFLTVDYIGSTFENRQMLNWQEIRQMHNQGINFGAHTLTHPDLTTLSLSQMKEEVYQSKSVIEDNLGVSVTSFAYPYGNYNSLTKQIVQQYFTCACSTKLAPLNLNSDLYSLERVDTYYLRSKLLFNLLFKNLFPQYLELRRIPRNLRKLMKIK